MLTETEAIKIVGERRWCVVPLNNMPYHPNRTRKGWVVFRFAVDSEVTDYGCERIAVSNEIATGTTWIEAVQNAWEIAQWKFQRGDRIVLSDKGKAIKQGRIHDRIGTVIKVCSFNGYPTVRWDGKKGTDEYSPEFLQNATPRLVLLPRVAQSVSLS